MVASLAKSFFLAILGAHVCPWGLTGLFDDRMVTTLLEKNCFLAVLDAYVCPWGLTGLFDDRLVATVLRKNCFPVVLDAYVWPWGLIGLFDGKMVATLVGKICFLGYLVPMFAPEVHADRTTVCFEPWQKLRARLGACKAGLSPPVFLYWPFQGGTSVVVPYCSCCLCLYFGSSIMLVTYFVNFR